MIGLVEAGEVVLFTSPEILTELEEVLSREKFQQSLGEQVAEAIHEAVEKLAILAVVIASTIRLSICRDPDDDKVLECAVAAEADCIVSGDRDLLDLGEF